jgi:TolB-like protein/DNA-binding winged helix-turn-helix (wHTH) protein/Tfp pilus assembly protein PilF
MPAEVQAGKPRIDLSRYELSLDGRRVKLERQPMELLILLVKRKGQLVTREDIVGKLWGKSVFVDADQSINAAVRKIRSALRDDPAQPKYLETVVGKGYRFTGDVEVAGAPAIMPPGPSGGKTEPAAPFPTHLLKRGLRVAGLLVVLLATATWIWSRWHQTRSRHSEIHSLAVLPLANLSGDPSQDYFAQGMTDELITELAQIGSLRVISRTSVIRYQGTTKALPQIAKELRVDAIVEGSVVRSGDKLRITAQLIDANTDRHLWAESFERDVRDVLSVQREVADKVAGQVNATLSPAERAELARTPVVNSQAYDAYLRGRFFWNKWTEDGVRKGIGYFQQAIQTDPNYPLSYAGLAESYISLGDLGLGALRPREADAEAEAAALKAIALDDNLAEGHAALAMARLRYDRDLADVEKEFKRAIELNPSSANAHHWYSHYLLAVGRAQEAMAEGKRAYNLNPVDPEMGVHLQWLNYNFHHYDEVVEQGRRALELDSNFGEAHWFMGLAYEQQRMYKSAATELQTAVELSGRRILVLSSFGHFLAVSGNRGAALKILAELGELSKERYVPSYEQALIYIGLGDKTQALAELEEAYKEDSYWMLNLQNDPRLDPLRSDARFQDLVRRVGVAH